MKKEEVLGILQDNGYVLAEEKAIPYGVQFIFHNGAKVCVFDKGTVTPQGQYTEEVKAVLGLAAPAVAAAGSVAVTVAQRKKVFVVYGHDIDSRAQLEAMLLRWGLEPLILDQLPSEGQTIIEKLERHTSEANFGVVLATPDDIGYRVGHEDEKAHRARQNVVLELGMLLSRLGRKNVAILLKQQANMERPSDIQGLIYIPFKDNVTDGAVLLAKEMAAQGYKIDIGKL